MNIEQRKVSREANNLMRNEIEMGCKAKSFYWWRKYIRQQELLFIKRKK